MSRKNTKILFLDIDGPMIPSRAACLSAGILWTTFDPVAVKLINLMLEQCDKIQIVLSSAWRAQGVSYCSLALSINGISPHHLHSDWSTGKGKEVNSAERRAGEIREWLSRHPEVERYAVLDDILMDIDNMVHVTTQDGLLWDDYQKLRSILV